MAIGKEKYAIINCDDTGSFLGANLAAFELLELGHVTSATIMTCCPWAPHAVKWAAAHPQYAIGLHLTTTSEWHGYKWGPVAESVPSLTDENGYFYPDSSTFEQKADMTETEKEVRAQLAQIRRLGLEPSHWDNHMGTLYGVATGRFEMLELFFRLSAETGLPLRFPMLGLAGQEQNRTLDIQAPGIAQALAMAQAAAKRLGLIGPDYLMPHDFNGPQKESYEQFRDYLYTFIESFPHGITETYLHPNSDTGEARNASGAGFRRVWEYQLYKDPKTRQHYKDCGIELISYRDLRRLRGSLV
ncbi:MAG: polysaccharide deacetylase family protein [Oscillospiraceae bacterium]|jgi:predicted glycoside hydrolase/deacetylase ChbG (UPF0249 family)|nr:polysaccharide deacetylase family protein [Oscillospiraceae bacterium]